MFGYDKEMECSRKSKSWSLNPFFLDINKQNKQVQCEDWFIVHEIFSVDHLRLQPNEDASKPPRKKQKGK
jgi:hypothetical protein